MIINIPRRRVWLNESADPENFPARRNDNINAADSAAREREKRTGRALENYQEIWNENFV